jgi:hypothetical protein
MSAGQVRSNLRTHTLEEKRGHHGQSSEGSKAGLPGTSFYDVIRT